MISVQALRWDGLESVMTAMLPSDMVLNVTDVRGSSVHFERKRALVWISSWDLEELVEFMLWARAQDG